jgi:urea transport system permease protein|tara:strand:- start:10541 stop:12208 length:1668 start_codon:yes stop_codon:yes gene_type:complete
VRQEQILQWLLAVILSLLAFLVSINVYADEVAETPSAPSAVQKTSLEALLTELTKVSLSKAPEVLDKIEDISGKEILPLFDAMLGGDLYYQLDSQRVLIVTKMAKGSLRGSDPLSGEWLDSLDKKTIKKIRVNNSLRSHLREAMARINLKTGTVEERRTAVLSMLDDLSPHNIVLLKDARQSEKNADVLKMIELALAMDVVGHSANSAERLLAMETLSGRLEPPVRNLLKGVVDNDAEGDRKVRATAAKALGTINEKREFYGFVEQLFFGLSLGSVLLLAAIGLAITFGVMGVINMAHGEMIMLGAYTTYVVQLLMPNLIDYSLWVAIPAAFLVSGAVGVLIERTVIRHLHGRPLESLLATFGISLILQQAVRTIFSPLNRQVSTPEWMSGSLEINPVFSITYNRLYILLFALLVFFVLQLILKKTSLGLNVRAVSQNRDMAKCMGIRTEWVDAMTFGLGSGIAGVAGVALSQLTNVGPNLGQSYIIDSFMVVVFGGVGNLLGTLVGGFTLGIANKFLEPVTGAVLANVVVLVFIILFIQKRPKGLFPQKGRAAE